jgi:hypothetical protein
MSCLDRKSRVWITLRPSQIDATRYETYETHLKEYKKNMRLNGFSLPYLSHNMRNSSRVVKALDSLYTGGKEFKMIDDKTQDTKIVEGFKHKERLKHSVPTANLPSNTVSGNMPVIIPLMRRQCGSDVVTYAVSEYFHDPVEPVVILVIKKREFSRVVENCCEAYKGKRDTCVYYTRGDNFGVVDEENLKEFLKNPKGLLITDAEAFGGMQARNIIVIGDSSKAVRNYIMRAISFIVFIQEKSHFDNLINMNDNVQVDKHFLP